MAERVHFRTEKLIPVMAEMERIQIFSKSETINIIKKIKKHEYIIQRIVKKKEDYLDYIKYLMGLLKLIKVRRKKYGNKYKLSRIDYKFSDKIHRLYKEAVFRFQDDLRIWLACIQFCKHAKYKHSVPRMLTRLLQVHQDKPKCWLIAATWEKEENKNLTAAENYLMKSLIIHPESHLLLTNIFKLSLEIVEIEKTRLNEYIASEDIPDVKPTDEEKEEDENILKHNNMTNKIDEYTNKSRYIYEYCLDKFKDVNLAIEFFNIAKQHKYTESLQQNILTDLVDKFDNEPLVWDLIARRELQRNVIRPYFHKSLDIEFNNNKTLKNRISMCNEVYKAAIKKINNIQMWTYYLECLIEININTATLPIFKKNLLKKALVQGNKSRNLTEKYYLYWMNMLSKENNESSSNNKIYELLIKATDAIPESINLWNTRLKYLLSVNNLKSADDLLTKAVQTLKQESLPLWITYLSYLKENAPHKVDILFPAIMKLDYTLGDKMKPHYIKYLAFCKGIEEARIKYKELCLKPPFCKELHKEMVELEITQPEIDLRAARYPYEMAIAQFGAIDVEVWIDYIEFEMKYGEAKQVSSIYNQAINTVNKPLINELIQTYSLTTSRLNLVRML